MKNSADVSPRFTCRVVRGGLSLFGDTSRSVPRGAGASHVAACEDCRKFFGSINQFELALKRDATHLNHGPTLGLEQRIVRAVNLSTPEPQSLAARHISFTLAGVAACAGLTLLFLQQQSPPPRPATPSNPIIAADNVWTLLKPSADALLSGDPLQLEVDAVVSDARSAVRFLERNFLPSPLEPLGSNG